MTEWKPITTAPNDTPILVYYAEEVKWAKKHPFLFHRILVAWCDTDEWLDDEWQELPVKPTHWMPLPEPPNA